MNFYEHVLIGFVANALAFWILATQGIYALNPGLVSSLQSGLFLLSSLYSLLPVLFSIALFSVLPDIDESGSGPSKLLRLSLGAVAVLYAVDFLFAKNVLSAVKSGAAAVGLLLHLAYARGDFLHRRFPHTFTFGIAACAAAFLLTGSKTVAVAGFIAFASHLAADWHVAGALKRDRRFWLGR